MTRSWGTVVTFVLSACLLLGLASGAVSPEQAQTTENHVSTPNQATPAAEDPSIPERKAVRTVQSVEIDRTIFSFTVHESGSARWMFEFRLQLENEEDVNNFQKFANFFRTNETPLYKEFQQRALSLVRSANQSIDRNMTATSFSRNATVERQLASDVGVLRIEFDWTNFARVSQDGVVTVGDVFRGQLFIDRNHSLRLVAGDGLQFDSVEPEPPVTNGGTLEESSRITWKGRREFADGRPRATLVPVGSQAGSDTDAASGQDRSSTVSSPLALGGLFLFAIVAITVALWHRGQLPVEYPPQLPNTQSTDSPPQLESSTTQQSPAIEAESPETASSEPSIPDEELLSDEDRVLGMLEERGGRMKQVNIVEETGWSKSKVSMLLSDMEEDDEISKIRIGRENIIAIDGQEPDAASSPFEDA